MQKEQQIIQDVHSAVQRARDITKGIERCHQDFQNLIQGEISRAQDGLGSWRHVQAD